MEAKEKRRIIEALVLSSAEPISAAKLAEIIPYCNAGQAKDLVNELNTEYAEQDRAFEIWEVAGGFQIRTRAEFSGYLQKLQKERALRLSQAALETLSIIAYRQPTTRAEIEDVRGVTVSSSIMRTLMEREWIRVVAYRDVPGKPGMYGTTRKFLDYFGLKSLDELPTLAELRDILELNDELGLDDGAEGAPGLQQEDHDPPAEGAAQAQEAAMPAMLEAEDGPDADAVTAPGAADHAETERAAEEGAEPVPRETHH
jgi:segregation and condensation protein B